MNPFGLRSAPAWLAEDPVHQIPRLLERLLEVADAIPHLYEELPWLKEMDVADLLLERLADTIGSDAPSAGQEATLTSFFSRVTRPIARMVEALYTAPLLRDRRTVGEILRRMAQVAGREPLAQEVVSGLCAGFMRRRLERLGREPLRPQPVTWRISWQPTAVQLRGPLGARPACVILVSEEATPKVLAFRCCTERPSPLDAQLALYDALVFPSAAGRYLIWHLAPPMQLLVQVPVPENILQAAWVWGSTVREVEPQESAVLRHLEQELTSRILDPVQFERIVDRACERTYGYAPLLAKRRAVRRLGWHVEPQTDPLRHCLGLRELLPAYPAIVGRDGTVEWHGWHYRDTEQDVLRYFPQAAVTLRPSPLSEALIAVYWNEAILCCAVADELRHADGSYRPYWFPYPRLGE